MKRLSAFVVCLLLCLVAAVPQASGADLEETIKQAQEESVAAYLEEWTAKVQNSELTHKTVTLYVAKPDETKEVELTYLSAYDDVPFIDVEAFATNIMVNLFEGEGSAVEYGITSENEDKVITLTRENGARMVIDFDSDAVVFDDQALFSKRIFHSTSLDILSAMGVDSEGNPAYFYRLPTSFERKGVPLVISMDKRYIPMLYRDGKGYLPLQTLNDFMLVPYGMNIVSNGENLFIVGGGNFDELTDLYYSAPAGQRSEAMSIFSATELCLALDMYYGLKEAHNIDTFTNLFTVTGLYEELQSTDPEVSTGALNKLAFGYLADMHTSVASVSHYLGKGVQAGGLTSGNIATSVYDSLMNRQRYSTARAEAYPDGFSAYEEIGNTAYIIFDQFLANSRDYYAEPPKAEEVNTLDTMGLVIYANAQISRENSPIENVVIDLSNNGGGQVDAAIYVLSWYLGSCTINFTDTTGDGQSSTTYKADVNLDRVFDANDNITSKNLYCIISPNSFSCGNLVPASFKSSGVVTLLGRASGGGACVVMQGSTADGTLFNYSSNRRLSVVNNGSYYDVDNGVQPDITLTRLSSFYNRKALTDYINSLY